MTKTPEKIKDKEKSLQPAEIVKLLDNFIIGQKDAKKAVAIALRNRWRRMQVPKDMREEISPKNILMIGPTGVGKTEIARRLANLVDAPFVKVEATKFTEVGYVGRNVESIIQDLAVVAVNMLHNKLREESKERINEMVENKLVDALVPHADSGTEGTDLARNVFLKKLRAGELEEREIEINLRSHSSSTVVMGPPGMEEASDQLQELFRAIGGKGESRRKVPLGQARKMLFDEISSDYIKDEDINSKAVELVEEHGIVFIDEVDKITSSYDSHQIKGGSISHEGVQRDLLPIVEGCSVKTRYGTIKTDHILFVASGAFHLSKPSDMIPELQGRLPIRVTLNSLQPEDFERILEAPDYSLVKQYIALLGTEGLTIKFSKGAIKKIASMAWEVNEATENIGARRLHTAMEKVLENISFEAANLAAKSPGGMFEVDEKYVTDQLASLIKDRDLSRYIL